MTPPYRKAVRPRPLLALLLLCRRRRGERRHVCVLVRGGARIRRMALRADGNATRRGVDDALTTDARF